MLPLTPPALARDPGYPVRARLLADPVLRRHALAALAALALGGCDGAATQPSTSTAPVPVSRPPPAERSPQPRDELLPEAEPVAIAMAGGITVITGPEPEPAVMRGEMAAPEPPPPVPVRAAPPEPVEIHLPLPPYSDT
jgi:hypothetical protein